MTSLDDIIKDLETEGISRFKKEASLTYYDSLHKYYDLYGERADASKARIYASIMTYSMVNDRLKEEEKTL